MQPCVLWLKNGKFFAGQAIGALQARVGELVFNTGMLGYQEVLTDPSYARQIVLFTHPHVGNTGINTHDNESNRVFAEGIVLREPPIDAPHWQKNQSLNAFLRINMLPGITGVDTRAITHILREEGAMTAYLTPGTPEQTRKIAFEKMEQFNIANEDLSLLVSTETAYHWSKHEPSNPLKAVVIDFGVKNNILKDLHRVGFDVTVMPAKSQKADILALTPDAIVLSNGPGDPKHCDYAIQLVKELVETNIPILGICLGHQLLALAMSGETYKMPFGQHGINQPVKHLDTGKVYITSQNHNYAVAHQPLPSGFRVTDISLFDQSIQGMEHESLPIISFQGHPEGGPGPHDMYAIFERFLAIVQEKKQ